jgi:hypothetical protein
MRVLIKNSMLLATAIALLSNPFAAGGSIKTFHRSWTHSGGYSHSISSAYTVADYQACRRTVVQNGSSPEVARTPVKSTTDTAKNSDDTTDRTATQSTGAVRR